MGEIRNFSRDREQILFKIDDDTFEAKSAIPARVMLNFVKKFAAMTTDSSVEDQLQAFEEVLNLVLTPVSRDRFEERMSDGENPIDISQIEDIVEWLFEQYGLRPTKPSEDSAPGPPSPASGTNSTDSTSETVLISSNSI